MICDSMLFVHWKAFVIASFPLVAVGNSADWGCWAPKDPINSIDAKFQLATLNRPPRAKAVGPTERNATLLPVNNPSHG
ncbi:hypothetical protein F5B21DRAFT_117469 [Xylaria acuta]|nr:hypothetical protein F5B21DRAFT_117469 [Xylaria acuta]